MKPIDILGFFVLETVGKSVGPRLTAISASQVVMERRSLQRKSTWPSFESNSILEEARAPGSSQELWWKLKII